MPKEGFRTVTLRTEVYDELQTQAEKDCRSMPQEIEHLMKKRKRKEV